VEKEGGQVFTFDIQAVEVQMRVKSWNINLQSLSLTNFRWRYAVEYMGSDFTSSHAW